MGYTSSIMKAKYKRMNRNAKKRLKREAELKRLSEIFKKYEWLLLERNPHE